MSQRQHVQHLEVRTLFSTASVSAGIDSYLVYERDTVPLSGFTTNDAPHGVENVKFLPVPWPSQF